jgi:hypothetical protein
MLENRREELSALRKERADAQRKLDQLNRQIERIEGGEGFSDSRVRNSLSLNDTLEKVLKEHGKPMRVGDIVDAVNSTGYRSSSANFRGIVNQTLIKDKRFIASERGTYQLKK